ncbi:hypothetical protein NDU88_007274 [Pleurodeles waltl]|uniref:Uncharacterized protein n=1 Tax=Pleurodeles waltl TaxID=8319 RepID=A0AAV7N1S8_PLEWA|nr:hypothetical protein NDU88_007274 [Pleurodeles waltl]
MPTHRALARTDTAGAPGPRGQRLDEAADCAVTQPGIVVEGRMAPGVELTDPHGTKVQQNLHESTLASRRKKRRHSGNCTRRGRVLGPTKTQDSQGKRVVIQAATSLTESQTTDKDKLSHTDVDKPGDSSDHESVVDPLGSLPHATPQTAEDIIYLLPLLAIAWNSAL